MSKEQDKEQELQSKIPLVVMVRDGTLVPSIWEYTQAEVDCPAQIALIVSNKKNSKGFEFARARGIKTAVLAWDQESESREEFSKRAGDFIWRSLPEQARQTGRYLVVAAGWPVIMTGEFLQCFKSGRVINLHRGLVSENPQHTDVVIDGKRIKLVHGLYGMEMCKAVLEQKLEWTGSSIHFMTDKVDVGEVILHGIFPVEEGNTLESLNEKIYKKECEILPQAIDLAVQNLSDF